MIEIKNLRIERPLNRWDVKVDRSSILGNPFHMKDESLRDEVCDKYKEYFYNKIKEDKAFEQEVVRLCNLYIKYEALNLFCWCFPYRCHAETIKECIEDQVRKARFKAHQATWLEID